MNCAPAGPPWRRLHRDPAPALGHTGAVTPAFRSSAPYRPPRTLPLGVIAAGLAAVGLILWFAAESAGDPVTWRVDGARWLLLDGEHVTLDEGFGEETSLRAWHDFVGVNPDRDEITVGLGRRSRLTWRVDARPGRFVAQVARLHPLQVGDDTPLTLHVRALPAERPGGPARESPSVDVVVPVCPAAPDAVIEDWREGPAARVELLLPEGAAALEIRTESPGGFPGGSAVALLSPRVVHDEPLVVEADDLPLVYEQTQHLLGLELQVPEMEVRLGERRVAGAVEELLSPVVEAVSVFEGKRGRPAVAVLDGQTAAWSVGVPENAELILDLALDARLPAGTSAQVVVRLDGTERGRVTVDDAGWRPLRVPLPGGRVAARRLEIAVEAVQLEPAPVARRENDLIHSARVDAVYVLERVRVGLGEPRLVREVSVPRRVASVDRPSVIVAHVETLRGDLLSFLPGGHAGLTPHLARLATKGVVWSHAFAPSSWTAPSTATLMTGLLPSAHGVVDHDRMVLPFDVPTLAERATGAGVATGAFVANDILRSSFGFGRGFGTWASLDQHNARQLGAAARGFLDEHAGQQFLLLLHYWDPHGDYHAPVGWRERFVESGLRGRDVRVASQRIVARLMAGDPPAMDDPDVRLVRQRYLGDVAYLDAQIGALWDDVEARGLADSTVLIITADHGEEFMEHGLYGHGSQLYDESVRVPLILVAPGGQWGPSRTIDSVVSTASLFATVLQTLAVPVDRDSVMAPLDLSRPPPSAFIETDKGVALVGQADPLRRPIKAIRTDEHLLVAEFKVAEELDGQAADAPKVSYRLYDLVADPDARAPRPAEGEVFTRLHEQMGKAMGWSRERRGRTLTPGGDAELAETLEALGYLGGTPPDPGRLGPIAEPGQGEDGR